MNLLATPKYTRLNPIQPATAVRLANRRALMTLLPASDQTLSLNAGDREKTAHPG